MFSINYVKYKEKKIVKKADDWAEKNPMKSTAPRYPAGI